jgi:DNA-binding transcriptional MocR family regulator
MKTPAFRDLSATAQALYLHIKFKFNGYNNGEINLSHREAAELLNLSKNTVGRYFDELQDKGFIVRRRKGYLGVEGKGKSSSWELTEEPLNGRPALRTYLNWKPTKKQN